MPATNLVIRDKIARELQNRETLPWALENRKLFPNAIFGNNVKYSPLLACLELKGARLVRLARLARLVRVG